MRFFSLLGKTKPLSSLNVILKQKPSQKTKAVSCFINSSNNVTNAAAASSFRFFCSKNIKVIVPSMGDSISEGTVTEILKTKGENVNVDDILVVLETDKVSVDVRSAESGIVETVEVELEDVVIVGQTLMSVTPGPPETKKGDSKAPEVVLVANETETVEVTSTPVIATTPVAAVKEVATPKSESAPKKSTIDLTSSSSGSNSTRSENRVKLSRMRLRISERLKESQNVSASLTTFQEVDMSGLMSLRSSNKESFLATHGVKLGFMSAFVKASSVALLQNPIVNASIDDENAEVIYRNYVDMSVAVATPKGLVTPVLHDTHLMSIADVEKNLAALALKARNGELSLEEMTGGNFTISNGGVFGSLMGTPILNRPQSAILGMHATKKRPVVINDEIVIRPMMYLALTYDHRLIDGRDAVLCLKMIADLIEAPERLLLF